MESAREAELAVPNVPISYSISSSGATPQAANCKLFTDQWGESNRHNPETGSRSASTSNLGAQVDCAKTQRDRSTTPFPGGKFVTVYRRCVTIVERQNLSSIQVDPGGSASLLGRVSKTRGRPKKAYCARRMFRKVVF